MLKIRVWGVTLYMQFCLHCSRVDFKIENNIVYMNSSACCHYKRKKKIGSCLKSKLYHSYMYIHAKKYVSEMYIHAEWSFFITYPEEILGKGGSTPNLLWGLTALWYLPHSQTAKLKNSLKHMYRVSRQDLYKCHSAGMHWQPPWTTQEDRTL